MTTHLFKTISVKYFHKHLSEQILLIPKIVLQNLMSCEYFQTLCTVILFTMFPYECHIQNGKI